MTANMEANTVDASLTDALLRPDIAAMEEYTPILPFDVLSARLGLPPEQIIKLDANENPYGPSPKALAAVAAFPYHHIYPDPQQTALRDALADYLGIAADWLLAGAGADELLDMLCRLFLFPGDSVVVCPPTFGMYRFDALIQGARVISVRRNADFSLPVAAIEAACRTGDDNGRVKLLFLTSPNNPDGSLVSDDVLARLLALPVVVVLDEAYAEFAATSHLTKPLQHPNLVVLRTFSKWAGLAGLRVGYGVFPPGIIQHLWKIKQPYNINTAAAAAAIASLADVGYLQQNISRIVAERERLQGLLRDITYLQPYPSSANFVLCRVVGRDALALKKGLERRGILVRYFNTTGLQDHIRISVGKPEQTNALIAALKEA